MNTEDALRGQVDTIVMVANLVKGAVELEDVHNPQLVTEFFAKTAKWPVREGGKGLHRPCDAPVTPL